MFSPKGQSGSSAKQVIITANTDAAETRLTVKAEVEKDPSEQGPQIQQMPPSVQ